MAEVLKKEIPLSNPKNCWDFFILYLFNTIFTIVHIVYLLVKIIASTNFSAEQSNSLSFLQIFQSSLISISLLGYFIFQIPALITFVSYIFEEVPETVSFKKNVNWLIRSQWFIPLFHLSLFLSKNQISINPCYFCFIVLSTINDIFLSKLSYEKKNNNQYFILQLFSVCLFVLLIPFSSFKTLFFYSIYKIFNHFFNKKVQNFIFDVSEDKIKKRMKVLGLFGVFNAVLCCFVLMNNIESIAKVSYEEGEVFKMIANFFKGLCTTNVTKIVTYFM
ncbi:hypothetical protein GVAV_002230 [Gurleya vavrai]